MSSVKSVSIFSEKPWSNGLVKRKYLVTLTDNNLDDHEIISGPYKVLPSDDGTAVGDRELKGNKDVELNKDDKEVLWNDTQADYYRRSLGLAMLIIDIDDLISYIPLFQAMENHPDSGNNAGQRATYLGVVRADYDEIAARFGDAFGVSGGVDTVNAQVWEELPPEWG